MKDKQLSNEVTKILEDTQERIIKLFRKKGYKENACNLELNLHRAPLFLIPDTATFHKNEGEMDGYIESTFIIKDIKNIGEIRANIYTKDVVFWKDTPDET